MISTHILDTSKGFPASGVKVHLDTIQNGNWALLASGETNSDGRFVFDVPYLAGQYRIRFGIEDHYSRSGLKPFFLDVPVAFEITDTSRKYHIPLLLNPYGYSTYRGS
jgi:5-hydroxyisourate hydrolase